MPKQNPDKKAILKDSKNNSRRSLDKHAQFDESNIKETYHPPGKDYGFMKIDEPKTPYNKDDGKLDPEEVAKKLIEGGKPKALVKREQDDKAEEEIKKRKEFEERRKQHYDEYRKAKLAPKDDADERNAGPNADEEEKMRRKEFEEKRKKFYDDFHRLKEAAKIDDDDEELPNTSTAGTNKE